uniref:hypothetical protein n=1 Tax=uncultured Brevibacillus sp. TaxID=169970 RepID=UPI002595527B
TDAAAAQAVDNKIGALPAVAALTLADKPAVVAARADYDALTAAQKALVTKEADLQAAEQKIADLQAQADVDAIAQGITSITDPASGDTELTLPTVPAGYTVAIKTSSDTNVIALNGDITAPAASTDVDLVLTVTHTASGKTADTGTIKVTVTP